MQYDLEVRSVTKQFKDFTAVKEVSFGVPQGSFFSILGPSGCGKTTLLRMIAGFTRPTSGQIIIQNADVTELPPDKRQVNLVFQNLALFPMMNVFENIAFGLRRRRENNAEIRRKVESILERVGLPGFGDRHIAQLSGGQKQRVAIARCLVLEPSVLLLDEPLGALDLKLREQMKVELKKLQTEVGTTFIYITHDQSEALVMSDRVAVMNRGLFEQVDTPQNLYANPLTPFVAEFVGDNNQWEVTAESGRLVTAAGDRFGVSAADGWKDGERGKLYVRPEALLINPDASLELNRMQVKVSSILFDGANSRLLSICEHTGNELVIALPQNKLFEHIARGDQITIGFHPDAARAFPAGA